MVISILISVISSIQPICTLAQFDSAISKAAQAEQAIIASAIFDSYQEQVQVLIKAEGSIQVTPSERLNKSLNLGSKADTLFDDLLASLSVLDKGSDWNLGIMNLRRTVLLQSRQVDNPWPAAVWPDIPQFTESQSEALVKSIDSFLINNIDADRQERFGALRARLAGDIETCQSIEVIAMSRWGKLQQLIDPYLTDRFLIAAYPLIDSGEQVRTLNNWIIEHVDNASMTKTRQTQFAVWNTIHNKLNNDVIKLIKQARLEYGFDPWSRGCAQPTSSIAMRIKNKLLQRSAEIQELQHSTTEAMLQQLTEEQRHQFVDPQ